jgi:DNA-binding protein H-NS
MSNLVDIQSQIDKLQKQANEIRVREFDRTVQDILAKMSAFGITSKDLQPRKGGGKLLRKGASAKLAGGSAKAGAKRSGRRGPSKSAGSVVAPKFRGPNGETWSGRGLMPRWLSALVASGKTKEQFAVGDA